MTTHQLANILLQQEDVPVRFQYFDGGNFDYNTNAVGNIVEYNGVVYLVEGDVLFPPDERYDEYEGTWIGEREDGEDDEWPLYDVGPIIHHEW